MADFGQETVQITRHRFLLRTPSNGVELSKALSAAARARAMELGVRETSLTDDALLVNVEGNDIVIWWEVPGGGETGHTG
jgi:hypothetical protein